MTHPNRTAPTRSTRTSPSDITGWAILGWHDISEGVFRPPPKGRPATMTDLFRPPPGVWGLRGDAYLWKDMRRAFRGVELPDSPHRLGKMLAGMFVALTGRELTDDPDAAPFFVARYAGGGMSSGMIAPGWWRYDVGMLLVSRWVQVRSDRVTEPAGADDDDELPPLPPSMIPDPNDPPWTGLHPPDEEDMSGYKLVE